MKLSYLLYIILIITIISILALCFLGYTVFPYYMVSKDDNKWLFLNSENSFPSYNSNWRESISHSRRIEEPLIVLSSPIKSIRLILS